MTIDELARESGMTARNIRAHQSRGLLPPPTVRARTGYYGPEHLTRIRLIQDMQGQGFNLKSIERLLEMGARGGSAQTLEFQRTRAAAVRQRAARGRRRRRARAAPSATRSTAKLIAKAERVGAAEADRRGDLGGALPDDAAGRAASWSSSGIPLEHALAVARVDQQAHRGDLEGVREALRQGRPASRSATARGAGDGDLAAAGEAVERLRPLASDAVQASFGLVMTRAVERQLQKELS